MNNDWDYARVLLDISFQEGTRYWTRNQTMYVGQALILLLVLNTFTKGSYTLPKSLMIVLCASGITLSILHVLILKLSLHYFNKWWLEFEQTVKTISSTAALPNNQYWIRLNEILQRKLPFPKLHSTTLTLISAEVFLLLWLFILYTVLFGGLISQPTTGA